MLWANTVSFHIRDVKGVGNFLEPVSRRYCGIMNSSTAVVMGIHMKDESKSIVLGAHFLVINKPLSFPNINK